MRFVPLDVAFRVTLKREEHSSEYFEQQLVVKTILHVSAYFLANSSALALVAI